MKKITIALVFLIAFFSVQAMEAQIYIDLRNHHHAIDTLQIKKQRNVIREHEKEKLKEDLQKIEEELSAGEITADEAEQQKKKAAKKRAQNIEDQLDIFDANINLVKRNKEDAEYYKKMKYYDTDKKTDVDTITKTSRTHSYAVFAFGFSNAIGDGQSIDNSPYKIGGSRFFEIGHEWSTSLTNNGFLRVTYGLKFQFNGLKPKHNQYFENEGDQTVLKEYPIHLKKAKLKVANLVVPVHFEIGRATGFMSDGFKLGLGGYAGLNLGTRQKLKYNLDGHRRKETIKGRYNNNNFIYGLSAYVGYKRLALYVKYDLNPIFKNNDIDERIAAVGIRLSFD